MTFIKYFCSVVGLITVLQNILNAEVIEITMKSLSENKEYKSCITPVGTSGHIMPQESCVELDKLLKTENYEDEIKRFPYVDNYIDSSFRETVGDVNYLCCNNSHSMFNPIGLDYLQQQPCGKLKFMIALTANRVSLATRPWMALLKYRNATEEIFKCGGTLITERYVLTAAQCIPKDRKELISVRLGEHKISSQRDCSNFVLRMVCLPPFEDIGIDKIFVNEAGYDIALLRLNRPVEFKSHIHPICLPLNATLQHEAQSEDDFYITGWGITHEDNIGSDVMMEAILETQMCETSETELCTGDAKNDTCKGDIGGPLSKTAIYLDWGRMVQFGIVKGSSGVYTNIASFMPWISHKISGK